MVRLYAAARSIGRSSILDRTTSAYRHLQAINMSPDCSGLTTVGCFPVSWYTPSSTKESRSVSAGVGKPRSFYNCVMGNAPGMLGLPHAARGWSSTWLVRWSFLVCTELTVDVYCPNLCTHAHRVLDFIISDHSLIGCRTSYAFMIMTIVNFGIHVNFILWFYVAA